MSHAAAQDAMGDASGDQPARGCGLRLLVGDEMGCVKGDGVDVTSGKEQRGDAGRVSLPLGVQAPRPGRFRANIVARGSRTQ